MKSNLAWTIVVAALGAACANARMPVVTTTTDKPQDGCGNAAWCAGAAETDITPPLGIGLFGHGPDSRIATGIQLRLRCQAFVIRGPHKQIVRSTKEKNEISLPNLVALVPCEIAAPGLLLQRTIAQYVAKYVPLKADQIMLMATHTHMGPAHFFAVESYYGPFSARMLGFDSRLLHFLAQKIGTAIVSAYNRSVPAKLSWSQRPVEDHAIGRNRSFDAYLANKPAPAWLEQRVKADPEHAADKATDPMLTVLSIDRDSAPPPEAPANWRDPIGVFAVYGVHPSAIANTNTAYTGDLFGYATREVEAHIRATTSRKAVVGIANGIEGDVMVARNATGLREAKRVSSLLAKAIIGRWDATTAPSVAAEGGSPAPGGTQTGPLAVAYRELRLPGAQVALNDERSKQPPLHTLCQLPELGTPSGGGANDHPTFLRAFPQYNPGVRTAADRGCEGHKLPVIFLGGRGEPGVSLPATVPISIIRIGSHAIVTLPAEVTTVTGIRLREAVARALDGDEGFEGSAELDATGPNVSVVGLTNEYIQYVATEEEYALQYYEGASTLYGPNSAEFLTSHAVCLARFQSGRSDDRCRDTQTDVGHLNAVEYKAPETRLRALETATEAFNLIPTGNLETLRTTDDLDSYEIRFKGPPWIGFAREDSRVHVQLCRNSEQHRAGRCDQVPIELVDDDTGSSVQTAYDAFTETWTAMWLPELMPKLDEQPDVCGEFRIVVTAGLREIESKPITLPCKPGAQ